MDAATSFQLFNCIRPLCLHSLTAHTTHSRFMTTVHDILVYLYITRILLVLI